VLTSEGGGEATANTLRLIGTAKVRRIRPVFNTCGALVDQYQWDRINGITLLSESRRLHKVEGLRDIRYLR